jgi:hypothetical protein
VAVEDSACDERGPRASRLVKEAHMPAKKKAPAKKAASKAKKKAPAKKKATAKKKK